jgi:SAM-dependent methyltransferase
MIELTPEMLTGLPTTGARDPIAFYRRPLVGKLYRERINMGLRQLGTGRVGRTLEIGYAAGAVLLALAPSADDLHGIDLDADPETVSDLLASRGYRVRLQKANLYQLPYPDASFDLAVCFSVFEHLDDYQQGLREVSRVLVPGGRFLLGMPAVNRLMEWGFRAIGFKRIEDHHVTRPQDVAAAFGKHGLQVVSRRFLGVPIEGAALYYTWLLKRLAA